MTPSLQLKTELQEAMKTAMRQQAKERLVVIRLILAAVKQYEVDKRLPPEDAVVIDILAKMVKQRRESIEQYAKAGRDDLVKQEEYEITVIQEFLPEALTDAEIDKMVKEAIKQIGATSVQDMGKVMNILKPQMAGRADMSVISAKIRACL